MEPFKVHILGCGSATPSPRHQASCQIVEVRGKLFMVDCAEGAQVMMRRTKVCFDAINNVFISHLHGDHCFGLIGMISTFGLTGRTSPLNIYAHEALRPLLDMQLRMFCDNLGYEVVFHPVDTTANKVVYEDHSLTVETVPLSHRVPCCGYLFREKPGRPHIRREMIDMYGIPVSQINNIKAGIDWVSPEGEVIPWQRLTRPADEPRSYAYCSDTKYLPRLHEMLKGVTTLYHEATYADDKIDNAKKYCHSTARQAATVARDAAVRQLIIGHFSARYKDETLLLDEARQVFRNTLLAADMTTFDVK